MNKKFSASLLLGLTATAVVLPAHFALAQAQAPAFPDVALSSLDVSLAEQDWGTPQKNKGVTGEELSVGGQPYAEGFGTHAHSTLSLETAGNAGRVAGSVGVNDSAEDTASVEFRVMADGKKLWSSGMMRKGEKAKPFSVDLTGAQFVTLEVTDGGDDISNDHADWLGVRFENVKGPIVVVGELPVKEGAPGELVTGALWRDTKGNVIQAHGGGMLVKDGIYYWYGEDRSNGYVGIGVSGYKSKNLVNWEPLGVVLSKSSYDEKWGKDNINERPKVVYNPRTQKYVMWFHYDRSGYGDSRAGIATSDAPEGPFKYLGQMRPIESSTYRDQTVFVDDDGSAYAVYSGEDNGTMHVVRLNDEWTAPQMPMVEGETWSRNLIKNWREAPAVWKYNGKYYMVTSGTSGWKPNEAKYAVADSMLGPWKDMGDPFVGEKSKTTFDSQSTFVMPLGGNKFLYGGDRWKPNNLSDSRYIWQPFEMKPDGTFEINYTPNWKPADYGFSPVVVSAATAPLRYRLALGSENWPTGKKAEIVAAMDEAVAFYNKTGTFNKQIVALYNAEVPTADGNFNGNIRFGKQIGSRTALHEIGHILGVGTVPNWGGFIVDGKWTGKNAIAQLREFDGPNAVLNADHQHFWPYGLNFAGEDVPGARRRHVLMVAALRADLGLSGDAPFVLASASNNEVRAPETLADAKF